MFQRLRNLLNPQIEIHHMGRIEELVRSSKEVIQDCQIENGAIVAANTDKPYYPKNVQNYRFIWPRDAAFILYAADRLEMNHVTKNFLEWMVERAEEFSDNGLVFHRYLTNGPRDPDFGHQYQPDQAGTLLWSIQSIEETPLTEEVTKLLADGLCDKWDSDSFESEVFDLWEERRAFTDRNENFAYTLAACSKGLERAHGAAGKDRYLETSEQMRNQLRSQEKDCYVRSWGELPDDSIDASLLGLVWPFDTVERDEKLERTVELIEEKLLTYTGVKRYEKDMYDGMIHHTRHVKKGAGGWPLLYFWYLVALKKLGREAEAKENFEDYLERIDGKYIPEQIFSNDIQNSIKPLAWSHAMFVVAADELGYL